MSLLQLDILDAMQDYMSVLKDNVAGVPGWHAHSKNTVMRSAKADMQLVVSKQFSAEASGGFRSLRVVL